MMNYVPKEGENFEYELLIYQKIGRVTENARGKFRLHDLKTLAKF